MKQIAIKTLQLLVLSALVAVPASTVELTAESILAAQLAGAPAKGMIAMIDNQENTVAITAGDFATLREAGVPEPVIAAIKRQIQTPGTVPLLLQPDNDRLVAFVRLSNSGLSEKVITEQVSRAGQSYQLSVNDVLYLRQNNVPESAIAALMAKGHSGPGAAPEEMIFDNLLRAKRESSKKAKPGRLVLRGESLSWETLPRSKDDFTIQTTTLDNVWFTCEVRIAEDFCHQINFKVVEGDLYHFRDSRRDTGSNAAVTELMDALRKHHPLLDFSTPEIDE